MPRIAVIACDVLRDEITAFVANKSQVVRIVFLKQGLHNDPPKLRTEVQQAIQQVEAQGGVDAIVLGYGLCSRGMEGVHTSHCRLVLPRAHDCITILLGDRQRYAQYVKDHPGTYWYSPGWNRCHTPPGPERHAKLAAEYAKTFPPDDVDYLMETEQAWFKTYNRATYVDMGPGATQQDLDYTRNCAQWLGWDFDRQQGDAKLLNDLLDGAWDDDRFLILEAGQTLKVTADERIVTAVLINGQEAPKRK